MRPRKGILPVERDRLIREAELAAYAHFGAHPEERLLRCARVGGSTAVRVMAFDPTAEGPPVVVLHGIASVSVLAAPLLPYLRDRPVYAVDWPGHGLSAGSILSPSMAFRTHAVSILRSILDELDLARVDLVGHSLGAQIGLYGALDVGDRLRRLVLLGAPGAGFAGTKPLPIMKLLAVPKLGEALLSLPLSERAFARNNERALGKGALDELPRELVEAAFLLAGRTSNAPSIASFFRGLIRRGSLRPGVCLDTAELGRVSQPTLMVWGDEDVFLKSSKGAESIASIRDMHLIRIAGAGHAPWLQAPRKVGRAIARHLDRDDDQSPTINIQDRHQVRQPSVHHRPRSTAMTSEPSSTPVPQRRRRDHCGVPLGAGWCPSRHRPDHPRRR